MSDPELHEDKDDEKPEIDDRPDDSGASNTRSSEDLDQALQQSSLPPIKNSLFKPPDEEEGPEMGASTGLSSFVVDISKLPPLKPPTPNQQVEVARGNTIVVVVSAIFVSLTHGVALKAVGGIEEKSIPWWIFLILIYTEVLLALICLVGLRLKDPGIIHRSPETCFPIPKEAEEWIQIYTRGYPIGAQSKAPLSTYIPAPNPKDGSYCVKCLVWRKPIETARVFHCQTCNRCVQQFDHHCSVFGRCIAGTMTTGNYIYFVTMVSMGMAGYATSIVALMWSLSVKYRPQIVIPAFIVILWMLSAVVINRSCRSLSNCICDASRICQNLVVRVIRSFRRR